MSLRITNFVERPHMPLLFRFNKHAKQCDGLNHFSLMTPLLLNINNLVARVLQLLLPQASCYSEASSSNSVKQVNGYNGISPIIQKGCSDSSSTLSVESSFLTMLSPQILPFTKRSTRSARLSLMDVPCPIVINFDG